jgi:acylphosphatase
MQYVKLIVSGRVQMVRFRVFVVSIAKKLNIIGTVENLPDGTVQIEAWGESQQLQELIERVHKGSTLSRVDNVAEFWDNKEYIVSSSREFRIIH